MNYRLDREKYLIQVQKVILWTIIDTQLKVELFHQMRRSELQISLPITLHSMANCDYLE